MLVELDFTKSRFFHRAVRSSFDAVDIDKSGSLDVKELFVAILKLYDSLNSSLPARIRTPSTNEMKKMMAQYDKDQNGTLNFDEYLLLCRGLVGAKGGFHRSLVFKCMMVVLLKVAVIPLTVMGIKEGLRMSGHRGRRIAKFPDAVFNFGVETTARLALPLPL